MRALALALALAIIACTARDPLLDFYCRDAQDQERCKREHQVR